MTPQPTEWQTNDTVPEIAHGSRPRLSVVLPHTDLTLTEVSLREAARLTRGLDARLTLLAVRIVPFPELLDPTRGCTGLDDLVALAESIGTPVTINIVYARDWEEACDQMLDPGSLIVIAVRKGWFRTREERLADRLLRTGHRVTTVPA